jgi:transcriptional regulator with XRE-family HTH domain
VTARPSSKRAINMLKPSESALPDPFDVAVGARIKQVRKAAGLSQTELGEALGISFQQIQKYERGVNRVSASALRKIAETLQVRMGELLGEAHDGMRADWALLAREDVRRLIAAFGRISDDSARASLLAIAEHLAEPKPA